jgi:hypothetical protein
MQSFWEQGYSIQKLRNVRYTDTIGKAATSGEVAEWLKAAVC